jgi:hypothetical protein
MFVLKAKVTSFRGKYSIPSEIKLENSTIIEKVLDFNYLRSNFTQNYNEHLSNKTYKFRSIFGVTLRRLKRKLGKRYITISMRLWRSQSLYISAKHGR